MKRGMVLASVCVLVSTAAQAAQPAYRIKNLGWLGFSATEAQNLNDKAEVAGYSRTQGSGDHAFLYRNGNMLDLGTLGGPQSFGYGINKSGEVTGWSYLSDYQANYYKRAFVYSNGVMTNLGDVGHADSIGRAINDDGIIVGTVTDRSGGGRRAFVYSNGFVNYIGSLGGLNSEAWDINNAGQITGISSLHAGWRQHAFIYDNGSFVDLGTLGGSVSLGHGINSLSEVAGTSETASGEIRAFLYSNGVMNGLGTLGGPDSRGFGLNDHGQVVGSSDTALGATHAFLYSDGIMYNLNDLIDRPKGLWLSEARDINNKGQIIANARGEHGVYAFLLTPRGAIPEPASWAMLIAGFGLVGAVARLQRAVISPAAA